LAQTLHDGLLLVGWQAVKQLHLLRQIDLLRQRQWRPEQRCGENNRKSHTCDGPKTSQ